MDHTYFSNAVPLKQVTVTDAFWRREQELVRREVIPYQWEALNDRVPGAAPSYCMHNFRAAGELARRRRNAGDGWQEPQHTDWCFETLPKDAQKPEPDRFYGFVFQDTDFSKWIEAVAYSLDQRPDAELEKTADEAIEIVCAAQHPTGYLDTCYILNGMDRAFTNLRDHHELYCLGHLIEGAVAYYQATGKKRLLNAACRFADYVAELFGEEEGKRKGYPGHEIAEMALVRLYEVTGEEKYLRLSKFFLDQRGTQPYYFDEEAKQRAMLDGKPYEANADPQRYIYNQAHLPVREQSEAVGHAVRAGYLYSGMADVARLTRDEELLEACKRLWKSIVREKLYITGGVGGTCHGEAFSYPFDLPNDTAYSETCAAIALAMFARRLLQIEPKAEYADVMEQALYNTVLAGMALDGKSFFYVNPLEVNPEACRRDARLAHVQPVRQKWFGCACCPPNIARTVASITSYAYTENEDTLWMHLFLGGTVEKQVGSQKLLLRVESQFPWDGKVTITVCGSEKVPCTVAFRIPGWCGVENASIQAPDQLSRREQDGYCYLTGLWEPGDSVFLDFPMEARACMADPRVRENVGKVAFCRGPLVYCAEEADNGKNLHLWKVDAQKLGEHITVVPFEIGDHPMNMLLVPAQKETSVFDRLYMPYGKTECESAVMKLIPYYAWANRGEGEMRVWGRVSQ